MSKLNKILKQGIQRGFNYSRAPLDPLLPRHCYEYDSPVLSEMLGEMGFSSLDELIDKTIPAKIRREKMDCGIKGVGEKAALEEFMNDVVNKNVIVKSFIGTGYYDTNMPKVILRNVLENPAWYTPYTPYQAEISQGRLESLLNFQTMISSLTGLPVPNSSLLDAGTAAGESMYLAWNVHKRKKFTFLVSEDLHPQTIEVIKTRAYPLNVNVVVAPEEKFEYTDDVFGVIVQYPDTHGGVRDYKEVVDKAHDKNAVVIFGVDLMSLALLKPPGELGADVVYGDNQRFGLPMGYGGPSSGFMVVQDNVKRQMPGRIIGLSIDSLGNTALRMALQTREQHIRRQSATSNICTATALNANLSAFYAIYHGPEGIKKIANHIHELTVNLGEALEKAGNKIVNDFTFDTVRVAPKDGADKIHKLAKEAGVEFRKYEDGTVGISISETHTVEDMELVASLFGAKYEDKVGNSKIQGSKLERTSKILDHDVFRLYQTEHELLRYMYRLETKDLAMTTSMIPLGSCTMKLNSTSSMIPLTTPGLGNIHPHTDPSNCLGYKKMLDDLDKWLCEITGFAKCSLQPNSGAAGEYTGMRCITKYHEERGESHRNVCLAPISAHGTNPATMAMCGLQVVEVKCDNINGAVIIEDLKAKAEKYKDNLGGIMITYPSTYGIFEEGIMEIIDIVHENGGLVYMDGANMNAQVGYTCPAVMGADVCHLNLHKTFSIPHGGGGPGIGPICVNEKLKPYLPNHFQVEIEGTTGSSIGQVASSPYGFASAGSIAWMYIRMLGNEGLKQSTAMAILNANYCVNKLQDHYKVLFRGTNGYVAHEFILDVNEFKKYHIEGEDIAKRLMDYGFHAPTLSFPVVNTLMVEPTESESKEELDRFCNALIQIREEIQEVIDGVYPQDNNVLVNAPHSYVDVCSDTWDKTYAREKAAFPVDRLRYYKFWPQSNRIDNPYGDRNFCCQREVCMDDLNFD